MQFVSIFSIYAHPYFSFAFAVFLLCCSTVAYCFVLFDFLGVSGVMKLLIILRDMAPLKHGKRKCLKTNTLATLLSLLPRNGAFEKTNSSIITANIYEVGN